MNVCSLYTYILQKEGIQALETTLKRKNEPTKVITAFLKLILTLNNFNFNCKNYLQVKDVLWELNAHLPTPSFFYHLIQERYKLYQRYIDDIQPTQPHNSKKIFLGGTFDHVI